MVVPVTSQLYYYNIMLGEISIVIRKPNYTVKTVVDKIIVHKIMNTL